MLETCDPRIIDAAMEQTLAMRAQSTGLEPAMRQSISKPAEIMDLTGERHPPGTFADDVLGRDFNDFADIATTGMEILVDVLNMAASDATDRQVREFARMKGSYLAECIEAKRGDVTA